MPNFYVYYPPRKVLSTKSTCALLEGNLYFMPPSQHLPARVHATNQHIGWPSSLRLWQYMPAGCTVADCCTPYVTLSIVHSLLSPNALAADRQQPLLDGCLLNSETFQLAPSTGLVQQLPPTATALQQRFGRCSKSRNQTAHSRAAQPTECNGGRSITLVPQTSFSLPQPAKARTILRCVYLPPYIVASLRP